MFTVSDSKVEVKRSGIQEVGTQRLATRVVHTSKYFAAEALNKNAKPSATLEKDKNMALGSSPNEIRTMQPMKT